MSKFNQLMSRFFFSVVLLILIANAAFCQIEDNLFYRNMAENLCEHIDSLGVIQDDSFVPYLLPMELSDLSSYLPEDQQDTILAWAEGDWYSYPFLDSHHGTEVFAYLMETCPNANDRFFKQFLQLAKADTILEHTEWKVLTDFILLTAGPRALRQQWSMYFSATLDEIKANEEANAAFDKLSGLIGFEPLVQLLMIRSGGDLPGAAKRFFLEKIESKQLEKYMIEKGPEFMLGLLDTIKAHDDIERFCQTWNEEGKAAEINIDLPIVVSPDTETKELFKKIYDGPPSSDPSIALAAGAVVMTGVINSCATYKEDFRRKLLEKVMKELEASEEEAMLFNKIAGELCDCRALGGDEGENCFENIMRGYGFSEKSMSPGTEMSPERERLFMAIMTLLPSSKIGCLSN